jgi:hypothetical protein
MGYTHYWYVKNTRAVEQALPLVAGDLRQLLPQLPPLAGWDGQGEPTLEAQEIAFNGVEPDDYETFRLEARPEGYRQTERGLFGFCKTERHPYDLAVQVALVLLKWHSEGVAPDAVEVDSDGNLVEWGEACRLVEGLGYPVDPIWVLGREVWQVKDQAGKSFYIERSAQSSQDPKKWLESLYRLGIIPFSPPYSLHGPLTGFPPGKPIEEGSSIYTTRGR